MKKIIGILALMVALSQPALAAKADKADVGHDGLERVSHISLFNGIDSWRRLDDSTIILWATPFRPYLVNLSHEARRLRYANSIGVTSSVGGIYEKFDSVVVDGIRYRIDGIYKLDRATAKQLGMHT